MDSTTFLKKLKSQVCIAYIDTDGVFVQQWFENKMNLNRWMKKMNTHLSIHDYFVSMGVKRHEFEVIHKRNFSSLFDESGSPRRYSPVLTQFVVHNIYGVPYIDPFQ